jgi:hypothetical protein
MGLTLIQVLRGGKTVIIVQLGFWGEWAIFITKVEFSNDRMWLLLMERVGIMTP